MDQNKKIMNRVEAIIKSDSVRSPESMDLYFWWRSEEGGGELYDLRV